MTAKRYTDADIEDAKDRLLEVVRSDKQVVLKKRGKEHVGLCPFHGEKTASFTVRPDKGFYHCFGCGAHGNAIDYVREREGVDFVEAMRRILGREPTGNEPDPAVEAERARRRAAAEEQERRDRVRRRRRAHEIWLEAKPAPGTVVQTYLFKRGIRIPPPATLRFLSHSVVYPAQEARVRDRAPLVAINLEGLVDAEYAWAPKMVAAVTRSDGAAKRFAGVHVTWLDVEAGRAFAKRSLGPIAGGAIRLAPPAPVLALAEGIETALSILQVRPEWSVWACISTGHMQALTLPAWVERIVICADNDVNGAGLRAAERAAARFRAERRLPVAVTAPAEPDTDFNDLLKPKEVA